MPSRGFLTDLPFEAKQWVDDGTITEDAAERIVQRYGDAVAEAEGPSTMTEVLYATAGVLIGAAVIAFLVVGLEVDEVAAPFAISGAALLAVGVALQMWGRGPELIPDALMVAGLVPLTVAGFPEDDAILYAVAAVLTATTLAWWRRSRSFVLILSVIAYQAAAAAVDIHVGDSEGPVWLAIALAGAVFLVVLERVEARPRVLAAALSVAGLVVPLILVLDESFTLNSEGIEVVLGLAMAAILAAATLTRQRGQAIGAALVLGIDAIVFAFDVGGAFAGTAALLIVAVLLIAQAETLKRLFRE